MDAESLQKFLSIILEKQLFTDTDMEGFGDEGGLSISRAKLQGLIKVVMKDATDEEKDAYRNDVAAIYKSNIERKIENTLKMYSDPDVLSVMGISDDDREETIELIKKQLHIADDLIESSTVAVTDVIKKMKL